MLPTYSDGPATAVADGIHVAVRLTPRARDNRIDGIANGMLKVAVTAPPAENQANDALLRLLAKRWRLPRRDLSIVAGSKSRNKTLHIAGDPAVLMARIDSSLTSK